ncbi:hypothetical protein FHR92_005236 [Fontibacillus solani]|uniref:Uncharacterized protein n=1 Tax=Fontibacillus solani TaxID=1572857 RepID=A0A7W3SZC9_9BACL|nr:hypothetical protein [Fontibacillus solani]
MSNAFQERIDRLTLFYLEKRYDLSVMSVTEYMTAFSQVQNEIVKALSTPHNR